MDADELSILESELCSLYDKLTQRGKVAYDALKAFLDSRKADDETVVWPSTPRGSGGVPVLS